MDKGGEQAGEVSVRELDRALNEARLREAQERFFANAKRRGEFVALFVESLEQAGVDLSPLRERLEQHKQEWEQRRKDREAAK
jgi:hypothetical protein